MGRGGERKHAGEAKEREVTLGNTDWVVAKKECVGGNSGIQDSWLPPFCNVNSIKLHDMIPN